MTTAVSVAAAGMTVRRAAFDQTLDLYWLPLGAGGRSVRLNGRVFEAIEAFRDRRPQCELYHAGLEVHSDGARFVVEFAPVPKEEGGVETAASSSKARSAVAFLDSSGCSTMSCAAGATALSPTSASRSAARCGLATTLRLCGVCSS